MSHVQENIIRFYSKLNELRQEEKFTDVTIQCESKSFKCHRLVLTITSPYFRAMFESNFKESTLENIVLQEVSAVTFEEVLQFIYTGNVDVNATNVVDLLRMSDYYSLPGIEDLCLQFVAQKHLMTMQNIFPLFMYACDTNKNDFVNILSSLIAEHFSVCCKLREFLEISFDRLQIILHQYLSLSSRNEESLLTAIMRWTRHKREERLLHLQEVLGMIQFERISPAYYRLATEMFIAEQDPAIVFTKPESCDAVSELQKDRILKIVKGLHVYVKYKEESLISIFSVIRANECTKSGQILFTDEKTNVRCTVSDDSYLYCLNYINDIPREKNREKQTFCAYTSIDRRITLTLTPPPVVFDFFTSICYMQNNIYLYGSRHSVVRTNSKSSKMFNDEEINRHIFVYNCSLDNWFPIPQRKELLYHSCMTVCENNLYLIGGSIIGVLPDKSHMQAFDFRSGWRTLPMSHYKYYGANCCCLNGKIYVCGGSANKTSAERYDPTAGKWEIIQPMSNERVYHRMVPFDNKLWVMGGWVVNDDKKYSQPSNDLSMNVYDTALNQWSKSSILTDAAADLIAEPNILDCVVFDIL